MRQNLQLVVASFVGGRSGSLLPLLRGLQQPLLYTLTS
jgi:hypothetical protein